MPKPSRISRWRSRWSRSTAVVEPTQPLESRGSENRDFSAAKGSGESFSTGHAANIAVGPSTNHVKQETDSSSIMSFQYNTLRPNEIRLFRFLGTFSNLEVTHFPLERAPTYVALSYLWGDPKPCRPIECNGLNAKIPANLHKTLAVVFAALQKDSAPPIWTKGDDVFLWADGISINQSDTNEKNVQVAMMSEIYRKAKGCIGYIGPAPPGITPHAAFETFARFTGSEIGNGTSGRSETSPPTDAEGDQGDFLESEWFLRSWVVQEAVISKVMMCLLGDEDRAITFPADLLGALLHQIGTPGRANLHAGYHPRLDRTSEKEPPGDQVHMWAQLKTVLMKAPNGADLIEILRRVRPTEATDNRDKVYSALGLVKPTDRQAITVNYAEHNTVEKTYIDLAKVCISKLGYITVLEHTGTKRSYSNMPTWVPDWSRQYRVPLTSRFYRAAGETAPRISLSPCGQKVITKAFTFDKIRAQGFEICYPAYKFEDDTLPSRTNLEMFCFLDDVCRIYCNQVQREYQRNPGKNPDEPIEEIIYSVFTADCKLDGTRRAVHSDVELYRNFSRAYQAKDDNTTQHALFIGAVLNLQRGRRICLTRAGLIGSVPGDAKAGDWIAILAGVNLPFVLRNISGNEFEVVGQAYVHGAMDGESIVRMGLIGLTPQHLFKTVVLI